MKYWQIILLTYLLSVPLPAIIMEALGIRLYYEQISFWLVGLYTLPLWLISEALSVDSLTAAIVLHWAAVAAGAGAWLYLRARFRAAGS